MKTMQIITSREIIQRLPIIIGVGMLCVFAACIVFGAATAYSKTYDEDLTQKHALLTSISEDAQSVIASGSQSEKWAITGDDLSKIMPATGKAAIAATPMMGTVTPEKNHNIIKEKSE